MLHYLHIKLAPDDYHQTQLHCPVTPVDLHNNPHHQTQELPVNSIQSSTVVFTARCYASAECHHHLSVLPSVLSQVGVILKWLNVESCKQCHTIAQELSDPLRSQQNPNIGLNGVFLTECIRLMRGKLTIFPYGQYIVGNICSLAFRRYSQFQDRSCGLRETCKSGTVISR